MFRRGEKHTMDVVEALAGHHAGRLVLVDVREDSERGRGFAPDSRHLPLGGMNAWERNGLDMDITGRTA